MKRDVEWTGSQHGPVVGFCCHNSREFL